MNVLIVVTSAAEMAPGYPTGVRLEEYAIPYVCLAEVGITPCVASPKGGPSPIGPSSNPNAKTAPAWGPAIEALSRTLTVSEVSERDFDALFIAGGHGAMVDLAADTALMALVEAFARAGKPIAALAHGAAALLGAKAADGRPLLAGRKATGFTDAEEDASPAAGLVPFHMERRMREVGALFEKALIPGGCHVARDGDLITGQNPASSLAIAKTLAEVLAERQRAALTGPAR